MYPFITNLLSFIGLYKFCVKFDFHKFVQKSFKYVCHSFTLKPIDFAWTYYFMLFARIILKFHDIVSFCDVVIN